MSAADPDTPANFPSSQTDTDLVAALRAGNTAALGALYDRHAGLVYGVALRILNNVQESEDLVHDVFLYLTREGAYDPARSSLRTFLAVFTRSRAIDRLRARSKRRQILQARQAEQSQSRDDNLPLEHLFQYEQSQEVRDAISQLSKPQQEVLKLMYYEGLSQAKIAKRLNLPLSTIKGRARRGLLRLRQVFKADPEH